MKTVISARSSKIPDWDFSVWNHGTNMIFKQHKRTWNIDWLEISNDLFQGSSLGWNLGLACSPAEMNSTSRSEIRILSFA